MRKESSGIFKKFENTKFEKIKTFSIVPVPEPSASARFAEPPPAFKILFSLFPRPPARSASRKVTEQSRLVSALIALPLRASLLSASRRSRLFSRSLRSYVLVSARGSEPAPAVEISLSFLKHLSNKTSENLRQMSGGVSESGTRGPRRISRFKARKLPCGCLVLFARKAGVSQLLVKFEKFLQIAQKQGLSYKVP